MPAAITGWGKCLPPAVMTNADLGTFLDTSDDWIVPRTGIRERRIAHVGMAALATVAASRALAAAGRAPDDFDTLILATATPDLLIPNVASRVQLELGNTTAAALDANVGCCGFVYGIAMARGLIETGVSRRAVVIGAERLSSMLNWTERDSAILFGDGAGAVVMEYDEAPGGLLAAHLACNPEPGAALMSPDFGAPRYPLGPRKHPTLMFDGREVFRHAVPGMIAASKQALAQIGMELNEIDLVIPHQANLRIIEAITKKLNLNADKVFTNLHKYGNTSAASIPIALAEALEEGRIKPGNRLLLPAFGAGLTSAAAIVQWGERTTPLESSAAALPECKKTAVELIQPALDFQRETQAATG
jgi:3-oxoacyl-[acyl-carrier-protein] synthase-3